MAHAEQTIGFPTFSGPALPAEPITPAQVATPGTVTRIGIVDGTNLLATATITVSP